MKEREKAKVLRIAYTVEFTHDEDGQRVPDTIVMSRGQDRIAHASEEAFNEHVCRILENAGIVKPQVVKVTMHDKPMLDFSD